MSEYDDPEFDDTEDEQEQKPQADGPKQLRQALAKAKKELAAALEERDKLRASGRARDIADALEAHGAPKRLAKYVDVQEASSDGVLAWLRENGEDFGWSPADEEPDEEEAHDQEQARRLSRASQQAPEGKIQNFQERIANAKSREELQEIYRQMGAA